MTGQTATNDSDGVSPRAEWPAILGETTIEVFATMMGANLVALEEDQVPVLTQITGMVGIAGPLSATLSLRCSERAATLIASQMLAISQENAASQQCDAVGEICNIVAGYFKAKVGLGGRCSLSLPTVIAGTNYRIRTRKNDVRIESSLLYENEPLSIALDIRT